ncbi:IclR family transcriptional regulator [Leifsonia poae]|uniref:IclR family transcriptional regulator n=1 Tax=Leifsonia poae TaxID=110933 RepID=UPI0022F289F9|nr:IclR family transcriptional regulator [Leifsonia poae]
MSQSLSRALDLLDLVARGVDSLDALADAAGVHKTTVMRLLQTLDAHGYVTRDASYRYHLGSAVFALAQTALDGQDVRRVASPTLQSLGAATGQTVHLAAYDDGTVIYIDKVESRQPLRMYSRIGLPAALHATAVAKVLLGGLDDGELQRIADAIDYERFTGSTILTPQALVREVRLSAERGWAVDHEEHETFMNCVGAPVFGADGRVAAAVSISVPNQVLSYDQVLGLLPALHAATTTISANLGYSGDAPFLPPAPSASHGSRSPRVSKGQS